MIRYRKALVVGVAAIAAIVGLLLVAPGFINWTPYRAAFAAQLSRAVGRPVAIAGDVAFTILPRPALRASNVHVDGRVAGDKIDIEDLTARLAFAPLLRGALQFRDLRLDDVGGSFTLDATWSEFFHAGTAIESESAKVDEGNQARVVVERVEIVNGDVRLKSQDGTELFHANAVDIEGRRDGRDSYAVSGTLNLASTPLAIKAHVGTSGADGVRAVSGEARILEVDTVIAANGRLSLSAGTFSGDVKVTGNRGASLLAAAGVGAFGEGAPAALLKPATATAKVTADKNEVVFDAVSLDLGGTTAKGTASWQEARMPQLAVSLDFAPVALETWAFQEREASGDVGGIGGPPSVSEPPLIGAISPATKAMTADIALRIPALSLHGRALRDGFFEASLARGELKLTEASVMLPGTTRVKVVGVVNGASGTPAINGVVDAQTYDARGLLAWFGLNVADVPAGRLSSASFQAALQGTPRRLNFDDIVATLDTARIDGQLTVTRGQRPFFALNMNVENVNFDSYRPSKGTHATVRALAESQTDATRPEKPSVYGVTPSGATFAGLGTFDADVHVQVEGLTAGGLPGGRIGLDLGLKNGALAIRTASLDKVAGTTAWFSGAVGGLGSALQFDNFQFDLAADDLGRLADVIGIALPTTLNEGGQASLTGTLNGNVLQAEVVAALKASGLTARATGQVFALDGAPRFVGDVEATHPHFSDLMRMASYPWPTGVRDPGIFTLRAHVAQDPGKTTLSGVQISVGKDRFAAAADIMEVDGRPKILAKLNDIAFDFDHAFPPAAPNGAPRAASRVSSGAVGVPWSGEPLTWSLLKGWTGEMTLAGQALDVRGIALQDFNARIVVDDEVAELADWNGKIFGAPGQFFLRMAAKPEPTFQAQFAVTRADFRSLAGALNGGRGEPRSTGTADVVASVNAHGSSVADMVRVLAGSGSIKISAPEAGRGLSAGLFGPLTAAAQLDVATPGRPVPVSFSSRFSVSGGIMKLEDAEASSRSHVGRFNGKIDIVHRKVNVSGTLVPRKAGEEDLPIAISGALDHPNIKLLPPES